MTACEFVAQNQIVALNGPILFNDSIACTSGLIYHNDGDGTFQLRGLNGNSCACPCGCSQLTTDYLVEFAGNITVPEGGTVGPIAVALALNGEPINYTRGIFTPAAVDVYGHVTAGRIIKVPWGCCPAVSIEYVNGSVNDPTFVPTPVISVVDGNLRITPVKR